MSGDNKTLDSKNRLAWLRRIGGMVNTHQSNAIDSPLLSDADLTGLAQLAPDISTYLQRETAHRNLGNVPSVYRGSGLEYVDSCVFQPGNEMRYMDWRLSARSTQPHVKVFREEHRPGLFILVDRRHSMRFGTQVRLKVAQAVRAAALLGMAARRANISLSGVALEAQDTWFDETSDEMGCYHFIHSINHPCPPDIGPAGKEAVLGTTLKLMQAILTQGSMIYLISDFHDLSESSRSVLYQLATMHQLKAIHIVDPAELSLPSVGKLRLIDNDANEAASIDTTDPHLRQSYQEHAAAYLESREAMFSSLNIPYLRLATPVDTIHSALIKLGNF